MTQRSSEVPPGNGHPDAAPAAQGPPEQDLLQALSERRFELLAQPALHLETNELVAHALSVRAIGNDGRLVAPPLLRLTAVRFGLMPEVDRWGVTRAAALVGRGHAVALCLSEEGLADPDMTSFIQRELVGAGADPSLLTVGITEPTAVGNEALTAACTREMRSLGCGLSLDEFGSAYGDFAYLERLDVDRVMLDPTLTRGVECDSGRGQVVQVLVKVAIARGLGVIAAGCEDPATMDELTSCGVQIGLGSHFPTAGADLPRAGVPSAPHAA
jgi:EAL domain-containing protein (putative c-di-GMP-specific phosphodiesterase class I)